MARISNKELETAIFRGQKIEPKVADVTKKPHIIFYTVSGRETEKDDDGNPVVLTEDKAFAKQELRGSSYRYFVTINNTGSLYDPHGLYASREETRRTTLRGRPELKLVTTKKTVFDFYLKFLATKNKLWLKWAERER